MTTNRDVRDMLGIEGDQAPRERPTKKARKSGPARLPGVSREVHALLGERAPPVPIQEPTQYKKKLVRSTTHVKWEAVPFTHPSRTDGLVLLHWRKKLDDQSMPTMDEDAMEVNGDAQDQTNNSQQEDDDRFARYNLQITPPTYDDAEYNEHLKSSDWTRDETDYLVSLYADLYGKWPVIADRYEFKPKAQVEEKANGDLGAQIYRDRTMEDMKARYYEVSAKMMAAKTHISKMTSSEFDTHEKMLKYDPKYEAKRKEARESMLNRSKEDKMEEEHLISELKRIYFHQEKFAAELMDIRERLDHSITDDPTNGPTYQTSAEITQLFQKVLQQDKNKKPMPNRRSLVEGSNASPTTATAGASNQGATASTPTQPQRKGSITQSAPTHRTLTTRQEPRFGVTTHERLTNGVTFRSDKLVKTRQAKSAVQTQKISGLLAELNVPELIQMPTTEVCGAMEKLVGKINLLLDARKVREKEENELMVAQKQKELKEGKGDQATNDNAAAPTNDAQDRDGDVSMAEAEQQTANEDSETREEPSEMQIDDDEHEQNDDNNEDEDASDEEADAEGHTSVQTQEQGTVLQDEDEDEDDEEQDVEEDVEQDDEDEGGEVEQEEEEEEAEIDEDGEDDEEEQLEAEEEGGAEAAEDEDEPDADEAEITHEASELQDEDDEDEEEAEEEKVEEPRQSSPAPSTPAVNTRGSTRNSKRSASVLSASSATSSRAGTKRRKA